MSLFGGFLKIFSPIAGAIVSAHENKKAINKANAAKQLGITNATGALNDQFASTSANYQPYITAGTDALNAERGLLGLNGNAEAGSSIEALKSSPLYTALFNNGRDSVLSSASATGGLRGGNVNGALYNNAQQTLAQVIQQQLANLGGLSGQGLNATGQLGQFGAQKAGAIANLDTGSGDSNAGAILGKQAVSNNMYDQLQKIVTSAVTGGAGGGIGSAVSSFLGGGGAPNIFSGSGSGYGANGGALPNFPTFASPLAQIPGGGISNFGGGGSF